jgi:hypothetical protein
MRGLLYENLKDFDAKTFSRYVGRPAASGEYCTQKCSVNSLNIDLE